MTENENNGRPRMTIPQDVLDELDKIKSNEDRDGLIRSLMATLGLVYFEDMIKLERNLTRLSIVLDLVDVQTPTRDKILDHDTLTKAIEFMTATKMKYFDMALNFAESRLSKTKSPIGNYTTTSL